MTKTEIGVLNSIETAYSKLERQDADSISVKTLNDFDIVVSRDTIILLDAPMVVAQFERGYVQLSQIVPLIAQIVEEYE